MTDQACAQTGAIQHRRSKPDTGMAEPGLERAGLRSWRSLEIDTLRWRWKAAAATSGTLPPFEELALDSLGGLGDSVALLQMDEAAALTILMAGKNFEEWIECEARKLKVNELSVDRARALCLLTGEAAKSNEPAQTIAHRVVDGLVCVYDLVALPLSNRWGQPLFLVYINERARNFNIVEAIFQATRDGLLALAVHRDTAGAPRDFQIVALNDGAALVMQGTAESLRGRLLSDVCAGIKASEILPRFISVFNLGTSGQFELECPPGGQQYFRIGVVTMGDLLAVTLTDISFLKSQEKSFRLLFEANPVPMWVHSAVDLKFLAANNAALAQYGYTEEAFLSMDLLDLIPAYHAEALREAFRNKLNPEGDFGRFMRHVRADGSRLDTLVSWRPLLFRDEPAQLAAAIDVTEKRRAEKKIAFMARHDALTGLPNRVKYHERLDEALARVRRDRERLAVLYLDLDNFKNVNDALGHPAGDKLLAAIAGRLRSCVRDGDIVARLGGDEFAVLQMGLAGPHESSALASRIIKAVNESIEIDGQQILIGVSAGIALAPADGETSDRLLKNADMALYRAKDNGRNSFRFFEPGMDVRLRARHEMERELRHALSAGEFELYYQPLVAVETGAISCFEALLRWRSPRRGLVLPQEFIPAAEDSGLIVPLGEWVLRKACAEASAWPENVKVAVNLSPSQFKTGRLLQLVFATLEENGLPAARLELEITETVLLAESTASLATLRQLRALGAAISMDDFGTGYSGMSYLRSFPFDKIKIDKSFVADLCENGECQAIVRAIVKLGLNLGIPTIAEGVETEAQREFLRKEGCTEMQGTLFSKPIPAREIATLLRAQRGQWQASDFHLTA
ncbi:MAG: EAL domain-containing protein [Beijerinckiaceae bacterium]|nr:EAL domain-containing protein [Beijerinckiaceae bacterium]